MAYLWIKAFHLIAVICWFAAIFYLPRLFVYHAMTDDQISKDRFKIMERKLYRGIGTPSMVATLFFGTWMIMLNPALLALVWMQVKLVLVALVVIYHFCCGRHLKAFAADLNRKSHIYFRWFNEAPVLALFGIVILVIVRPFS